MYMQYYTVPSGHTHIHVHTSTTLIISFLFPSLLLLLLSLSLSLSLSYPHRGCWDSSFHLLSCCTSALHEHCSQRSQGRPKIASGGETYLGLQSRKILCLYPHCILIPSLYTFTPNSQGYASVCTSYVALLFAGLGFAWWDGFPSKCKVGRVGVGWSRLTCWTFVYMYNP